MATQRAVMRIDGEAAGAIKSITIVFEKLDQLAEAVTSFSEKADSGGDKAARGFKKVAKEVDNVGKKAKKTQTKISALTRTFGGMSKVAMGVSRAFSFASKQLMKIRNMYMAVTDAARLATQGVTNFGRSMFFFVSLPLIGFMKNMMSVAIDFEDQMVRVGKTTNLWGESLKPVTAGLRKLARNTMTSHVELATMAEQVGQLGVTGADAIVKLTTLFNMLAVTTNIAADDVATKMGKISSAFGWNLDKSQGHVTRLANTINQLENTTAASADEILDALFKVAAVAGTLGISAADATAFATALVSTGFSAEEAGTAVRNLAYYMSQNTDAIHNAMKGFDKYSTVQKVTNELNKDFAGVILDVSSALAGEEENVNALVNAIEIGHLRGGKALAAFGNSFENLAQIIANAREEWAKGNSLMIEYDKAMTSTAAQMGLLKNNINDVGLTLGEAFLPYINKIIMTLVPAIREVNEWFGKLADKTKLMYIGFVLLLIVAGPVVMFMGQMFHGVTLLMMGFGQLIKVFSLVMGSFSTMAKGIAWLFSAMSGGVSITGKLAMGIRTVFVSLAGGVLGWTLVIAAAVVIILKILSKMGVDVAGFFTNIATKASEWGTRLMETYGTGLAKGFQYVLQVITWIANTIASFFKAASPPKEGPLSTINKWGGKLMAVYLKGFYNADFSILSGIGKIIQRYLTFGTGGDDSKTASALRNVLKARMALSQLIDIYNKTGAIDQGLLAQTTKGLGHMTKHVQKLIGLWLEYNKIQQRIKDLEAERQETVRGYQAEVEGISASNMSLEDKVNAIRQAQFARDDELRAIDKEKAALEEESEVMQDQLKWQQQFVDAMMDQDDMMSRLNDTLNRMAKAMESLGGLGGDLFKELEASIAEAEEAFANLQERLDEGKTLWDALKSGFAGEEMDWIALKGTVSPETFLNMMELYDVGVKIREVYDEIVAVWETLEGWGVKIGEAWAFVKGIFGEIKAFFVGGEEEGDTGLLGSILSPDWDKIKEGLKEGIHGVVASIMGFVLGALGVTDEGKRSDLADRWATIFFDVVAITARSVELAGVIVDGWIESLLYWLQEKKAAFGAWWDYWWGQIKEYWYGTMLGRILSLAGWIISGLWEGFKTAFDDNIENFTSKVEEIIAIIKEALGIESPSTIMYEIGEFIIQGLWDGMVAVWDELYKWFTGLTDLIPGWLRKALNMSSPSKVMQKLGEDTMSGYLLGLKSMDASIHGSVLHTASVAPLAVAGVNLGGGGGGVVGGGISIVIHDPVVREDSDLDRLAEIVADKIASAIGNQQGYGGQSNW